MSPDDHKPPRPSGASIPFRALFGLLLLGWLLLAGLAAAQAQPAQPTQPAQPQASAAPALKVATRAIAPFVIQRDGRLEGFSMDLWRALAGAMGRDFEIVEKGPLSELLQSVETREADLAIAAISITSAREERFDFSQPMFESGLQIMVRSGGGGGVGFTALRNLFSTDPMPLLLSMLAFLIVVPAHVVWLAERGHPDAIVDRRYVPGIFHALWWATGAAQGQQLDHPKSPVGKAISAVAIFVSVIFIAFFTANVTTALTVQQLKGDIDGPEDLPGRKVATVTGSTAANFLRANNAQVLDRPAVADAIRLLLDGQAEAVVFDSPVLLHYAGNEGKGRVAMAGQMFRKEAYGIMFPQGSPLRKPVNEALLKLREDGTYDRIYNRWFQAQDRN
jgi:polar amino acid transport system substrate-binding protein